jgi:hypothetical protein
MPEHFDDHSVGCDCFSCAIRLAARRCIDDGLAEDWAIPSDLIDMLAEHLTAHVPPANHLLAVERYAHDLRTAVNRRRPDLGATVLSLNDRRHGVSGTAEPQKSTDRPDIAIIGRSGNPKPENSPKLADAFIGTFPISNVTLLAPPAQPRGHGPRRRGRPTPNTMTVVATISLTAEVLADIRIDVLYELWWACQAWCDITPPRSDTAETTHNRFATQAYDNQQRLDHEFASRSLAIPIAPNPTYITVIRADQALGQAN